MKVTGLDHVQIAIPIGGEDAARSFFVGLLGMCEVSKPANLSKQGCWFESGSVRLHVGVDPQFSPARKAHPALLVSNLTTLRQELESAGVQTQDEKPVVGYVRFFAEDPFGNRIEFMQKFEKD